MKVITILGGGTAGFCTAAVLSQYVKNNNLDIVIKCVYSSKIGRIGVGESTQLAINDIFPVSYTHLTLPTKRIV